MRPRHLNSSSRWYSIAEQSAAIRSRIDEIYEELPPLSENNVSFILPQPYFFSDRTRIHSAAQKKIEAVISFKNSSRLLSQPSSTWQHTNYDGAQSEAAAPSLGSLDRASGRSHGRPSSCFRSPSLLDNILFLNRRAGDQVLSSALCYLQFFFCRAPVKNKEKMT